MIGDDQRRADPWPEAARPLGHQCLEPRLKPGVERCRDLARAWPRGDQPVGQMRGQCGERPPRGRHALAPRRGGLLRVERAGIGGACQHPVPSGPRRVRGPVRPPGLGRLRQRDEESGLGRGQAARLLAEPGEARGAQSLEVAAIGRERQVEPEDRVLVEPPLQRQCHPHLPELAAERPRRSLLEEPRHLHRQGRAAGDDAARRQRLDRGSGERERIDAGVAAEAPVLEGDELVEIAAVDRPKRHRQPPASIGHRIGRKEGAVPVHHHRRGLGRQRGQHRRIDPAVEAQGGADGQRQRRREERRAAPAHGAAVTVTVPASVRAR